jgi:glycosyltransferase involved in cell wall biosynthesis
VKEKLCLVMMVRNESAVIERALDSCRDEISEFVITDTGSTDNTPELIEAWAKRVGMPGTVIRSSWLGWGPSRTYSWRNAQRYARARYGLILDADDMLRPGGEPTDWSKAEKDGYYIRVRIDTSSSRRPDILKLEHNWKWQGADHPGLSLDHSATFGAATGWEIIVAHDGGRTSVQGKPWEKFALGAELLRAEVEADQTNARAVYYLAQNLRDAGSAAREEMERLRDAGQFDEADEAGKLARGWFDESLAWYERRARIAGFEEERWHALVNIGRLCDELGHELMVPAAFLVAYQARPSRSEPLVILAEHYRCRRWHDAALLVATRAIEIPYPEEDFLPIQDDHYAWGARFEYCHAMASIGRSQEAAAAWLKLAGTEVPKEALDELERVLQP